MSEADVLKTIIAEAGGKPENMAAVAAVINNRALKEGKTPSQIVKAKGQFEGYSNPGPAVAKQLNDPNLLSRARDVFTGVQNGTVADPTNGGTMYHADYVTPYWAKSANQNGTVNIGGNIFYKGSGAPQTAIQAINSIVPPNPQSRPSALAYAPQDTSPSVRAISVNPNGSPILPQMQLPQAAMYGINRLDPNHVTHAPTDFTTQDVGVPDARLSQLNATFPQPANAFIGSRATGGAVPLPTELTTRKVPIYSVDSLGNPILTQPAKASNGSAPILSSGSSRNVPTITINARNAAPSIPMPPKVTGGDNLFSTPAPTQFQQNNQAALSLLPGITGAGSSGSSAMRSIGALNAQPKSILPAPFAGANANVSAYQTGAPTASHLAAINAVPVSHTAVPTQRSGPTPSPVLAFNGDQNTGIAAPVAAINGATSPFGGSAGGIGGSYVPSAIPLRPSSGLVPLTQFNTVNPTSQIVPRVQSTLNSSPIGHVASLLSGEPVQGGLLGMLFNHSSAPVSQSLAQAMATAPISADTHAALMAQQSPDQRGQAALQASGMLDNVNMVTGSGGHSLWGSH